MQDFKIKLENALDALTNVTHGAWIRLIFFIASWATVGIVLFCIPTNYTYIALSLVAAVVATLIAFWKNNSFTHVAQRADNYIFKYEELVLKITKVSAGTWTRAVLMIATLINLVLAALGKPLIELTEDDTFTVVSFVIAILIGLLNYWKNNSFTKAGQAADEYIHSQKKPDLKKPLCIDEAFELIEAFLNKEQHSSDEFEKFKDVADFLNAWMRDNKKIDVGNKGKELLERAKKYIDSERKNN